MDQAGGEPVAAGWKRGRSIVAGTVDAEPMVALCAGKKTIKVMVMVPPSKARASRPPPAERLLLRPRGDGGGARKRTRPLVPAPRSGP